jgi:hypothetical protein
LYRHNILDLLILKDEIIKRNLSIELSKKYLMKININQIMQQGIAALKEGEPKKAAHFFNIVLQTMPEHADANLNLGVIAAFMNKTEVALKLFKKAIDSKPNFTKAHKNLGVTLQKIGRLDEAEISYKNFIKLKHDDAEVHYNMGIISEELNKLKEAEENYKKAIEFKPDYLEAKNNLSLIIRQNKLLDIIKIKKTEQKKLTSNPFISNRKVEVDLVNNLYKHATLELNKINISKVEKAKDARYGNGRCSDFQLFENNNSIIKKVNKDLTYIMSQAVSSDIFIIDSFFNILQSGGGTTPHNHINKFDKLRGLINQKFSLTYYLSIGDQNCSEPGVLKLYDPAKEILPSEGSIVIIPASRQHSAVYNGKKDRVMIGINFYSLL